MASFNAFFQSSAVTCYHIRDKRRIAIQETTMQIFKWGDGLAVELSQGLVDELRLREGDELYVVAAGNGTIVIETKEDRRRRAIENLAARNWTLPLDYKFDRDQANER
jgi:antitoxin MazE